MKRSTIIYLILFAALAGVYLYLNNREQNTDLDLGDLPTPIPVEYLFTAEDGLPSLIRIQSEDSLIEVERNSENIWVLTEPIERPADQGLVEAAASQVTTLRVLDHIPGLDPASVGLDQPAYKITLQFTSGVERMVDIGVLTPTETGYYAREMDNEILILSSNAIDALIEMLNNPPYLPPTPTLLPENNPEPGATAIP